MNAVHFLAIGTDNRSRKRDNAILEAPLLLFNVFSFIANKREDALSSKLRNWRIPDKAESEQVCFFW
jgi:hypothetical protein